MLANEMENIAPSLPFTCINHSRCFKRFKYSVYFGGFMVMIFEYDFIGQCVLCFLNIYIVLSSTIIYIEVSLLGIYLSCHKLDV